jgi:hypothetical protein
MRAQEGLNNNWGGGRLGSANDLGNNRPVLTADPAGQDLVPTQRPSVPDVGQTTTTLASSTLPVEDPQQQSRISTGIQYAQGAAEAVSAAVLNSVIPGTVENRAANVALDILPSVAPTAVGQTVERMRQAVVPVQPNIN